MRTREQHRMSKTGAYKSWVGMLARCYNPHRKSFKNYGALGIKVCARWRNSFVAFLADMGKRPEGLTLERINGKQGYKPSNCKWATYSEQNKNRRWFPKLKGSKHGQAKLTEADVLVIRERLNTGETQEKIAVYFGINKSVISRINTRGAWRHV